MACMSELGIFITNRRYKIRSEPYDYIMLEQFYSIIFANVRVLIQTFSVTALLMNVFFLFLINIEYLMQNIQNI